MKFKLFIMFLFMCFQTYLLSFANDTNQIKTSDKNAYFFNEYEIKIGKCTSINFSEIKEAISQRVISKNSISDKKLFFKYKSFLGSGDIADVSNANNFYFNNNLDCEDALQKVVQNNKKILELKAEYTKKDIVKYYCEVKSCELYETCPTKTSQCKCKETKESIADIISFDDYLKFPRKMFSLKVPLPYIGWKEQSGLELFYFSEKKACQNIKPLEFSLNYD